MQGAGIAEDVEGAPIDHRHAGAQAVAIELAAGQKAAVALGQHVQVAVVVADHQVVAEGGRVGQLAAVQRLLAPHLLGGLLVDRDHRIGFIDNVDLAVSGGEVQVA